MQTVSLGRMRRVVCASPELLGQHGIPRHPEVLSERPCVRFRGNSAGGHWHFLDRGRELNVPVSGAFTCSQAMAVAQACVGGHGFGHLLHYQVAPFLQDGRLEIVLEDFEPEPVPVNLVYPEAPMVASRLRTLVAWLHEALQDRVARLENSR